MLRALILLASATAFGVSGVPQSSAHSSKSLVLSGIVVFEETGVPVPGARVTLEGAEPRITTTDSLGRYRFDGVDFRSQWIETRGIGMIPERREIRPRCTVTVVDQSGRVLTPSSCTSSTVKLNFYLRPETFIL